MSLVEKARLGRLIKLIFGEQDLPEDLAAFPGFL